MLLQIDPV